MKTHKLLTHRQKAGIYRIVTFNEFRAMDKFERAKYFVADQGTLPFLKNKVEKLTNYVGHERKRI